MSDSEPEDEDPGPLEDIVYIAQDYLVGVKEDVKSLLSRVTTAFDEYEELRFHHFVSVWKEMKFEYIFRGRDSYRDLMGFTEGLLHIVKREILSLSGSLGYRAAGIYALYSLYFKQPSHISVQIRLTLPDVQSLGKSVDAFSEGQHWDILYCMSRLIASHAFHFTATEELMGMDVMSLHYIKKDASSSSEMEPSSSKRNPFKSKDFQSQLSELAMLQNKYVAMKDSLAGGEEDPSLSFVKEGFEKDMEDIIAGAFEKKAGGDSSGKHPTEEIGDRRKRLVDKYFNNAGLGYRQKELENFKNSSTQ